MKRPTHLLGTRLRSGRVRYCLSAAVLLLVAVPEGRAADRFWGGRNPGSGTFSDPNHWAGSSVAGANDIAHFGVTNDNFTHFIYTVTFTADATNLGLVIEDDLVTFNLNGHLYSTGLVQGIDIGTVGGRSGLLTVINGVMNPAFTSLVRMGAAANAPGTLVVGAGGQFFGFANIVVGNLGPGTLTVQAGGDLLANDTLIGQGSTGNATVTGPGSALVTTGLKVGITTNGTLDVLAAGQVESNNGFIGVNSGITGTVHVDGANSRWRDSGGLSVGENGSGILNITAGGQVDSNTGLVGNVTGSTGTATVDGANSKWAVSKTLTVGRDGSGTLNVTGGGTVVSDFSSIGTGQGGGAGTVNVAGAASQWINSRTLNIGLLSRGALNISDGGLVRVNSDILWVGSETPPSQGQNTLNITGGQLETVSANVGSYGAQGAVTVGGANALWSNSGDLAVGYNSIGTLSITAGGRVDSTNGYIAREQGSEGHVTLDGKDGICSWILSGDLNVGYIGKKATLDIKNGGQVQSVGGFVGGNNALEAVVTVDGKSTDGFSAQWVMSGNLIMSDIAELDISNGGRVENAKGTFSGEVNVFGPNSRWINLSDLSGRGRLNIADGARVEDANASVEVATVSGPGAQWIHSGQLEIDPVFAEGSLTITGGGLVQDADGLVGGTSSSSPAANVIVDGPNSQWLNSGSLLIGRQGSATLIITNSATVQSNNGFIDGFVAVSGANALWTTDLLTIDGRLTIGQGGTVIARENTQIQGNSSGGGGELDLVGGTLDSTMVTVNNGGTFNFLSGTLHVETFNTFFNGSLVNKGGTLAPGHSPGKTTIKGDYTQQSLATLQIEMAGRSRGFNFDFVSVSGTAALGGQLQVIRLNVNEFLPLPTERYGILEAAAITGAFSNAANGQRLATAEGLGSFIVNYGPGSPFPENLVVLSDFQCASSPGDCDCDGDVDLDDYAPFPDCLGGPGVPFGPTVCECIDLNGDGAVDLSDLAAFQAGFTGP
jgi:T5SS/PEP-CTERM-associated repeat protein